jgi:hypothetical protein
MDAENKVRENLRSEKQLYDALFWFVLTLFVGAVTFAIWRLV